MSWSLCWHHSRRSKPRLKVEVLFRLGLFSSISSTGYAATCVLCSPWMRTTHISSLSAPRTHLFPVVMRLDNRSETSIHFVVQRQLTDVPDCKKNNLQQLLTSIHKSHFIHGVSPRDFVTFLQTCTAIYKVEPNATENIFCQVKTLLPPDKWHDALHWHEIVLDQRNVEFSPSLKKDVFHFQHKSLSNGLFGVERRTKVWTAATQSCT